jgi:SWI/SNF-related matrix-associated actin-dependent regulator of chromatin subfamily A-like protein 1
MVGLFPFQQEGIKFALAHEGALIADQMGLGKSATAIGIINADLTIHHVLIVCPASMRIPWQRELEKWLTRALSIGIIGVNSDNPKELFAHRDAVIINYDRLYQYQPELLTIEWDLAILDEAHFTKSPDARRTRIALAIKARRRLALSGTPLLNRPIEIQPVLGWLCPQEWPADDYWSFAQRYCGARYNGFGWDLSGASNLPELAHRLRSTVMIRRTKAEVLKELPPKIRTIIELIPTADLKRCLKREREAYEAPHLRVNHEAIDWENLSVVRHETALAKVPLVVQYIRELVEGGAGKIVVFAHHRDVIAYLRSELNRFNPVILIGGMGPQERQGAIDAFMTDPKTGIFIGNIQAAGIGITLAPTSSHCVFAELSWTPAEMSQCEDRLARIGQIDAVTIHHLVLEGSLDAMMIKVLIKKQGILDQVLEPKSVCSTL